jgi:hypothetical protein
MKNLLSMDAVACKVSVDALTNDSDKLGPFLCRTLRFCNCD